MIEIRCIREVRGRIEITYRLWASCMCGYEMKVCFLDEAPEAVKKEYERTYKN